MAKFKVCVCTQLPCVTQVCEVSDIGLGYMMSVLFFVCLKNKEAVAKLVLV